jgi:two-component system sensor histidine kinase QseC
MGLNAGPHFTFNEAVSFFVSCETQQEVDTLRDKLLANGGKPTQCVWLKDQFGLYCQIIPNVLPKLLSDPDREKAGRAVQAMMQMVKIDGPALQRAFDGA